MREIALELLCVHVEPGLEVVPEHVVAVEPRAVVEVAVSVVLVEVREVLVVVAGLLPLDHAEVGEQHVVVVEVLLIGKLLELRYLVRELGRVIVARLRRCRLRVARRQAAARGRRRAQRILRRPVALAYVGLAVLAVQRVRVRVIAEILAPEYLVNEAEDGVVPTVRVLRRGAVGEVAVIEHLIIQIAHRARVAAAGEARRAWVLKHVRAQRLEVEAAAVCSAGIAAIAAAHALSAQVGKLPFGIRRRVVPVALVAQQRHACIRVALCQREVGVREFAEQPALLCRLAELVVGVPAFGRR